MAAEAVTFESATVFQAIFEVAYASREALLPPGLHPTNPPMMVVLGWKVTGGPWGDFTMAQVRVSCRSGVRPRGFVIGTLLDSETAAAALSSDWGMPSRVAPVRLDRFYDAAMLSAGETLTVTGLDPDPLGSTDVQFTVTTTLAHTPRGLRLVQVEPEYTLSRAERIRPRLESFDPAGWGAPLLDPVHPVSASVSVGSITIPKLRFMSRPDVLAFEGTEAV
jgi:hypothetical protein